MSYIFIFEIFISPGLGHILSTENFANKYSNASIYVFSMNECNYLHLRPAKNIIKVGFFIS